MLASGVRYVIGALWTIPQLATAVLMRRCLELLKDDTIGICAALCHVQRELITTTRGELSVWFRNLMAPGADLEAVLKEVSGMDEHPFANPYHWAGLQVVGDV